MDFREEIVSEHSRANAERIAHKVLNDPSLFDILMNVFLEGKKQEVQRAAYALMKVCDVNPNIISGYHHKLIQALDSPIHDAVSRNILRMYQLADIPEEIEGELYDRCWKLARSKKEAIAIKVFAMTILTRIAICYPELIQEVTSCIKEISNQHDSAGIRSRSNKLLLMLKQKKYELH